MKIIYAIGKRIDTGNGGHGLPNGIASIVAPEHPLFESIDDAKNYFDDMLESVFDKSRMFIQEMKLIQF